MKKRKRLLVTAAIVLLLDRLSKWLVVKNMNPHQSIPLIPKALYITYVRNPGAAFGAFSGKRAVLVFVALFVLGLVAWYSRTLTSDQKSLQTILGMQVGGALGNLIDRVQSGYVVDFLDFRVWPVFNLADSAVVISTVVLVFLLLRAPEQLGMQEG